MAQNMDLIGIYHVHSKHFKRGKYLTKHKETNFWVHSMMSAVRLATQH
jgi:hypothetical protein